MELDCMRHADASDSPKGHGWICPRRRACAGELAEVRGRQRPALEHALQLQRRHRVERCAPRSAAQGAGYICRAPKVSVRVYTRAMLQWIGWRRCVSAVRASRSCLRIERGLAQVPAQDKHGTPIRVVETDAETGPHQRGSTVRPARRFPSPRRRRRARYCPAPAALCGPPQPGSPAPVACPARTRRPPRTAPHRRRPAARAGRSGRTVPADSSATSALRGRTQ